MGPFLKRQSVVIGGKLAIDLGGISKYEPTFEPIEESDDLNRMKSAGQVRFDLEHQDTPNIGDIDTESFDVDNMHIPDGDPRLLALTSDEALQLEAHKLADQNPFGSYNKRTSVLLNGMLAISEADDRIPDLEGWLLRKGHDGKWKSQYVVVRGAFILWSDQPMEFVDVSDKQQRQKFNLHFNLYSLTQIERVKDSKTKWQFSMGQKCKEKATQTFIWKAKNGKDCGNWVMGLQHRKDLLNLYNSYIEDE